MSSATREALKRRHLRWIQPHEEAFAREYRALMGDLREQIRTSGTKPFALGKWQDRAVETMAPVYQQTILAGGRSFLTSTLSIRKKIAAGVLTKAKASTNALVVSLEQQFAERLRATISTTYDALESVLAEAVADNLDAEAVNDLIDEEWDDILGPRTDAIALTETNGAVNSVRDYLMQQLVELQSWVTAGDDRVRMTHAIYGGAGPKPVGFDWATLVPDVGYVLRYPCDPECHEPGEVVNCRCFVVPAGEIELSPADLKDYLEDFDMDPEDVLLSEDQKGWAVKAWEEQPRNPDGTWGSGGGLSAGSGAARAGRDSRVDGDGGHIAQGGYYEANSFGRSEPDRVYPFREDPAPKDEPWPDAHRRLLRNEIAREITGADKFNRIAREDGRMFATGHPVEFVYAHNRTAAPKPGPDDTFQQNVEPAGMYVTHVGRQGAAHASSLGLEVGRMRFQRPLVIAESESGDRLFGPDSWKAELSRRNGGKTGRSLTRALVAQGYDGIVTVGRHGLGEIVALPGAEKKTSGSGILKDFNPDQPRDESGRWTDIFGASQPMDRAGTGEPDVNTTDPSKPDYAVDAEDASATPPQHATMSSEEMNRRTDEVGVRRDALKAEIVSTKQAEIAAAKAEIERLDKENEGLGNASKMANAKLTDAKEAFKAKLEEALVKDRAEYTALKARSEEISKTPFEERSQAQSDELSKIGDRFIELDKRWGGEIDEAEHAIGQAVIAVDNRGTDTLRAGQESGKIGGYYASGVTLDPVADRALLDEFGKVIDASVAKQAAQDDARAYNDARSAQEGLIRTREAALASDSIHATAERQAIAEQGVDYAHARMAGDKQFYKEIHGETADAWKHIGGKGPITLRFAAEQAFGLEHGIAFDSKLGRAVTDLDADYPGASKDAVLWAAALRHEYDETQKEISEGVEFTIAGEDGQEIDYDALSEMEHEAFNNMSISDKVDVIEGSKKLRETALNWGMENEEEVIKYAENNSSDDRPEPYEYVDAKTAREIVPIESEQIVDKLNHYKNGRDDDGEESDLAEAYRKLDHDLDSARSDSALLDPRNTAETGNRQPSADDMKAVLGRSQRMADAIISEEHLEDAPLLADIKRAADLVEAGKLDEARPHIDALNRDFRQWAGDTLKDFKSDVIPEIDPGRLQEENESAFEAWDEAHREWLDPYYLEAYADADPDNEIAQKFSESFEPDEYPYLEGSGEEDIEIKPDQWPLTLHRTATVDDKATYVPNFIESWAYNVQHFGRDHFEEKVDPARVLVFQGAKNWTTPKGQASMGTRENEFILLPEVPKYVREARARFDKVRDRQDEIADRARAQKVDALMERYRSLQRLQDFGTRDQHEAARNALEGQISAAGLTWDDLIEQARKEKP